MENSKIEWTKHTFNPWRGCTKVSPGCANCYAETLSGRNPKTLGVWGPKGTRVVAAESMWREPLKWDKAAQAAGERHRVFCASLADVFEDWAGPMTNAQGKPGLFWPADGSVTWPDHITNAIGTERPLRMDDLRERLFFLIRDTPHLDWLLLTKRPQHILSTFARLDVCDVPETFPNLWLGTSVENQATADERIPHLLDAPAKVRFLSCEPLLGPVDLSKWLACGDGTGVGNYGFRSEELHWVIVGGESGPGARPMHPEWARSLRDQCQAAGVAFHFKQWGEHEVATIRLGGEIDFQGSLMRRVGKKAAGRMLDGRTWDEVPKGMTTPRKLLDWAKQPHSRLSTSELAFVRCVEDAAVDGVGYGFMQQVIEWMWQEQCERDGFPGGAWGPEYFNARIRELEAELAKARRKRSS